MHHVFLQFSCNLWHHLPSLLLWESGLEKWNHAVMNGIHKVWYYYKPSFIKSTSHCCLIWTNIILLPIYNGHTNQYCEFPLCCSWRLSSCLALRLNRSTNERSCSWHWLPEYLIVFKPWAWLCLSWPSEQYPFFAWIDTTYGNLIIFFYKNRWDNHRIQPHMIFFRTLASCQLTSCIVCFQRRLTTSKLLCLVTNAVDWKL
jgi:hypothetical protein